MLASSALPVLLVLGQGEGDTEGQVTPTKNNEVANEFAKSFALCNIVGHTTFPSADFASISTGIVHTHTHPPPLQFMTFR